MDNAKASAMVVLFAGLGFLLGWAFAGQSGLFPLDSTKARSMVAFCGADGVLKTKIC